MLLRKTFALLLLGVILLPGLTVAQTAPAPAQKTDAEILIDKMKDEGMNRSQVMQTLSYLSDVIGPRLTASPGMKRGNEWTRDQLTKFGLENAHLEAWGPFGRGWSLKKFYAMVDGPTAFPLIAYPKAWSPGTDTLVPAPPAAAPAKGKKGKASAPAAAPAPVTVGADAPYSGDVVHFTATKEEELEQYKGKLKGKIVLVGPIRDIKAHFEPEGTRDTEKDLLALADAPDPAAARRNAPQGFPPNAQFQAFQQQQQFNGRRLRFLSEEGAAILIDGARGDGGTIFVQQATAVQLPPNADGTPAGPAARLYDKGTKIPIQISAAAEHFNRVARMVDAGENVKMTIDLAVEYQDQDLNGYNTVAEIPGTDLKDQIVMLGGHLDSWQSGTGATDNGAGCAVMMEAVRIIKALGLQPRRTIRIALWTGEEQGLLGSREYVKKHFGYFGSEPSPVFGGGGGGGGGQGGNANAQKLTMLPEYDKLSAYFNIDNGTGKIRGVYMQGNENVRSIFRNWLSPFKDMGANTLTLSNTGGTDHLSFDSIGLPGFQFIQDEIEYSARTHHSNMDVFDRIQADDMKQISIIVAAFVYQTAMMDEKMPRKPQPGK